jgi:hypothetical protein
LPGRFQNGAKSMHLFRVTRHLMIYPLVKSRQANTGSDL